MKNVKWLIFLMGLSIVGVLLLQGRWLTLSYSNSEQNFDASVRYSVIKSFEDERSSHIEPAYQKWISILSVSQEAECIEYPIVSGDDKKLLNDSTVSYIVSCNEEDTSYQEEHEVVFRAIPAGFFIDEPQVDTQQLAFSMRQVVAKMQKEPINLGLVKNILASRLKSHGIEMPFELVFYDHDAVKQTTTQLAPGDNKIKISNGLAVVSFKKKRGYLLGQIRSIILSSFFLSGLAISCLMLMLWTILRQKHLSEMKNDFISNMTHELKTPISVISAANEAMQNFNVLEDKKKTDRYLGIARHELERLAIMVEKVLQAAQFEKKNISFRPEPINIAQLLELIVEKHQLNSPKQIHFSLANALKTDKINLDRIHFSNVLNNIIDNAIKYSGEEVNIEATLQEVDDNISISISDNGKGMSKDGIKRAFEKFYREPTGNIHNIKGFGLGLHYVKSVVEMIGGNVLVQSQLGEGSKFIISIPKQ